jgi:cytochrome c5
MISIRALVRSALAFSLSTYLCAAAAVETEEIYTIHCAQCHTPGMAGAPKVGDKAEWTRRIRAGRTLLYRSALEGVPNTAMTARGGQKELSDDQVRAVVDYMVNAAALDPAVLKAAARYEKLKIEDRDFIRLDANYDGFIAPPELTDDPVLAASLGRFDENKDGRLSPAEFRKAEITLEAERAAVNADDESLVRAVRAALERVNGLTVSSTKVEADHGTVAMIGMVSNAEVARRAYIAVKRIPGIKKIDNRLVSVEQLSFD